QLPAGAYGLDRAASFAAALEALHQGEHDVCLVDYLLDQRTGLDLIGEASRLGCRIPMIVLTKQLELEIDLRAIQAGDVDVLVKDQLNATSLERSMRYALQLQHHQKAVRLANQQLEEHVQERTAELAKLNEALQEEIAQRKRIEEQLREEDRRKN